ncbi:MAG: hypothetical protein IPK97_01415 [Ahniella sp.]|nr:hypothetical protein [Ahniella sp.]
MNVLIRCLAGVLLFLLLVIAPSPARSLETLTPEQAAEDVRVLRRALLELHPGLTKYQSEAEWQAKLARFEAAGQAARTPEALYLAASELAAGIRCGHTWTNVLNQQGAIKSKLLEAPNKLPFRLQWVADRLLVMDSVDGRVRRGDEILTINGANPAQIRTMLWPYLRADGASDQKRLRQLGHDRFDYSQMDITWPLLSPPVDGRWRVQVKRGAKQRTVSVKAVSLKARATRLADQGIQPESEAWQFKVEGQTARLTLPTFSFWNSDFDWKAFLRQSFKSMSEQDVHTLVIDIRANEGGDGAIGARIVQHLIDEPIQFESNQSATRYERVPYILARYLDTWDFGFFDRTGQVRPIADGPQAGMLEFLPRAHGKQTFEPIAPQFRGKVFLLIGGENSSATFQFAQLAQTKGVATLVGQSTGGNRRGLSGGQLAWVNLPNSGVAVDIPLLATRFGADTPDAPIHPDIEVERTFEGQRAGIDEEMAMVQKLMAED